MNFKGLKMELNIYFLDKDPLIAAMWHCDIHVNSQLTQASHILRGAIDGSFDYLQNPYISWARESKSNWLWLHDLATHLHRQWQIRTGQNKTHAQFARIPEADAFNGPAIGLTDVPLPGGGKAELIVALLAYREHYNELMRVTPTGSYRFQQWVYNTPPYWWIGADQFQGRLWCGIAPSDVLAHTELKKHQVLGQTALNLELDQEEELEADGYFLVKPAKTRTTKVTKAEPKSNVPLDVAEFWASISYSAMPELPEGTVLSREVKAELLANAYNYCLNEPDQVVKYRNWMRYFLADQPSCQLGERKVKSIIAKSESSNDYLMGHLDYWVKRGKLNPLIDQAEYQLFRKANGYDTY